MAADELLQEKKSLFSTFWRKKKDPDLSPLDSQNMRKNIVEMPFQIQNILKITGKYQIKNTYDAFVFAGMGGSAAPAELLRPYLQSQGVKTPIFIVKEYDLPPIPKNSIVFVMSYSGNTEETVNMLRQARRNGNDILILASGGKLAETARIHNLSHIMIPTGLQPREAVPYFLFCLLRIFENSKIIPDQTKYIDETIKAVKKPIYKEMAEQLAQQLVNKIPLIYTTDRYRGVGHKWKINLNETAKNPSFFNVFPEMNHNEILGFKTKIGEMHIIILRDEVEHKRNEKRIAITKKLLKKEGYPVTEVVIKGTNYLTKMISALYIGDWTSYFLALASEKDPSNIDIVEEFKDLMNG